jgi:hypothetical protein
MAFPWDDGILTRTTIWGDDGLGTYRPVSVDNTGALKIQGASSIAADVLDHDPDLDSMGLVVRNIPYGTYETLLLNDTVVLQAEVPENQVAPGSTTVLTTGGLDKGRVARHHAVDQDGRVIVSIKGTDALRWSQSKRVANVAQTPLLIIALHHKGDINGTPTTDLAYLDILAGLADSSAHVDVILNPTINNPNWNDVELAASFMEYDTAGTYQAATGRVIFGFDVLSPVAADLSNLAITMEPDDVIAFVAYLDAGNGAVRITPNWHEAP